MDKRTTKFYRRNESEVMKKLGFRPTKNSGSGWIEKEDGISEHCICQLKSTDKNSISIKQNDLNSLALNSIVSHKIPVFAIQFLNNDDIWIMVRPEDIYDIKDIISDKYKEKYTKHIDIEPKNCYNNTVKRDNKREALERKKYETKKEEEYKKGGKQMHWKKS